MFSRICRGIFLGRYFVEPDLKWAFFQKKKKNLKAFSKFIRKALISALSLNLFIAANFQNTSG